MASFLGLHVGLRTIDCPGSCAFKKITLRDLVPIAMCMNWGTKQNGQQDHSRDVSLGSEVLQRDHDVAL